MACRSVFFFALLFVAVSVGDPCHLSVKASLNSTITSIQQLLDATNAYCPDLYLTLDSSETYDEDPTKERIISLGLTSFQRPINLYLQPGGNNTGFSSVTFDFNQYFNSVSMTGFKFRVPSYPLHSKSFLNVTSCHFNGGKGISLSTFANPLSVENSVFEYLNLTTIGDGAIVALQSDSVILTGNIFQHNAGIRAIATVSRVVASNNTFLNNTLTAYKAGGSALFAQKRAVLNNNTFIFNRYFGESGGGGAFFGYSTVNATGNLFVDNHVIGNTSYGGAMAIYLSSWLYGNTFINNSVSGFVGGAICSLQDSSVLTLGASNRFIGNTAGEAAWGGAIFTRGAIKIISRDNDFIGNIAGAAGAIGISKASTIQGNFLNNKAFVKGGAVGGGNQYANDIQIDVDHARFINNTAVSGTGGAIDSSSMINMLSSDVEFEGNSAYWGGAISASITPSKIRGKFRKNSATFGGAIIVIRTNLTLTGTLFENNVASSRGGVVCGWFANVLVEGTGLDNNSFSGNVAELGGGAISIGKKVLPLDIVDQYESLSQRLSNPFVTKNGIKETVNFVSSKYFFGAIGEYSFVNNRVLNASNSGLYWGGGAILVSEGTVALGSKGLFDGNTSPSWGGAVNTDRIITSGVTFRNNNASVGGAIYATSYYDPQHIVENNVFEGNQASIMGQALYIRGPYSTSNNVFTNNLRGNGKGSIAVAENTTLTLSGDTFTNSNVYLETNTSTLIKGSVQVEIVCSDPSKNAPYGPDGKWRCVPRSTIPTSLTSTSLSSSSSSSSSLTRSSSSGISTASTEESTGTETTQETGTETFPSNNTNTKTDGILTKGSASTLSLSLTVLVAAVLSLLF